MFRHKAVEKVKEVAGKVKPKRLWPSLTVLIITVLSFVLSGDYFSLHPEAEGLNTFLSFVLLISGYLVTSHVIARYSHGKKLIKVSSWIVVIAFLIGAGIWATTNADNADLAKDKNLLLSLAANVESAKILSQTNQAQSTDQLEKLEVETELADYRLAILEWSKDSTPEAPRSIKLAISYKNAQAFLRQTLGDLAILKAFGDAAIARGDKDAMRAVAGKLAALNHLLDNLNNQEFAVAPGTAQAVGRTVCTPGNPTVCVSDIHASVGTVWRSARGYSVGDADAAPNWPTGWEPITSHLEGIPVPGVEDSQQSGVPGPVPASVNAFWATCNSVGGTNIGTSVKNRLPSTESGYTCNYKNGSQTCWDFLTYSGARYQGGDSGCAIQNLLPPPPPPTPNPNPNPQSTPNPQSNPNPNPNPAPTPAPNPTPAPTPAPAPQPPAPNPAAGSWRGTWVITSASCNGFGGNWSATVDNDGNVSGSYQDTNGQGIVNISGNLSGQVSDNGWTVSGSSGITFRGTSNGSSVSGTFNGPDCVGNGLTSGTFSGNR